MIKYLTNNREGNDEIVNKAAVNKMMAYAMEHFAEKLSTGWKE